MQRFAIYDLDRTITRLPTWSRFLLHAARSRAPWRMTLIPAVGAAALLRAIGVIDRDALKQIMHRLMLGRAVAAADMARLADSFAAQEDRGNIHTQARARIAADRAAGFHIVIATAAHAFYAHAIAARLGITAIVATQTATDKTGRILHRIVGENCYGSAKHRMIAATIGAREAAYVRFYSDHLTDLPTFEWADEAIIVNPGRTLRRIAETRNWEILRWTTVSPAEP